MELILISESKLKIMLTADDMENYDISNEQMTYEKKETRRVFEKLLDEAREKTGFDSSSERIFIQVYPSKNGGCEVYVTLNTEGKQERKQREKSTAPKNKKEYCVYLFENIDDALSACCVLRKIGYKNESSLYSEQKGKAQVKYYLVLQEDVIQNTQGRKRRNVSKSDLANEYGKKLASKEWMLYIREHGKAIVEKNAVQTMSVLR
ncbi:MAG: adaptor protein MecA [Ruminococcaceae bacterium]|nr:adaptor protein MecA [Oscillospiraceae bacterium]